MKFSLPEEFVLLDLEWTSWEGFMKQNWQMPGKYREVIQIGAIRIKNLTETAAFTAYIKPVKNPQLSEYVQKLTGITQQMIDTEGKTLSDAQSDFSAFIAGLPLASWTAEDVAVLRSNCELLGLSCVIPSESINIRSTVQPLLDEREINVLNYTSGSLIEAFGKTGARAHDAVNDMRNLLEVLKILA